MRGNVVNYVHYLCGVQEFLSNFQEKITSYASDVSFHLILMLWPLWNSEDVRQIGDKFRLDSDVVVVTKDGVDYKEDYSKEQVQYDKITYLRFETRIIWKSI
jgi:hypothetical protein